MLAVAVWAGGRGMVGAGREGRLVLAHRGKGTSLGASLIPRRPGKTA